MKLDKSLFIYLFIYLLIYLTFPIIKKYILKSATYKIALRGRLKKPLHAFTK